MPALQVILDGNGAFLKVYPGKSPSRVRKASLDAVTGLESGMESGKPSVGFLAEDKDGGVIYMETSLQLFLTAADALKARYGDPRT